MDDQPGVIKPNTPASAEDLAPQATTVNPQLPTNPNPTPIQPQIVSPDGSMNSQTMANATPTVVSSQPIISDPQPVLVSHTRRSKLKLLLGLGLIVIICAGSAYAFYTYANKTSYQTVMQKFITAMQNKDKATADSLESPFMKATGQKYLGNSSFYTACQSEGQFCTPFFTSAFLSKATKSYQNYKSSNGAKGKELVYTLKQAGGQGCGGGGSSTSTLTIAAIPSGNTWLIDGAGPTVNSDNVKLCPTSNTTTSVGN